MHMTRLYPEETPQKGQVGAWKSDILTILSSSYQWF